MTYPGSVTEQVEEIRRQTIAVLDELIAKAGEFELAEPPTYLLGLAQRGSLLL